MPAVQARPLLAIGPLPQGLAADLEKTYSLTPLWTQPDRQGFLAANKGRYAGAVTMSRHGADAGVMACVAGGVVACFGVGFEGLDLLAAEANDVAVSTTPDVLTDCVADLAFGLILASARQITAADRHVQRGAWAQGAYPLATRVSGKRLGIVGLGRIGQAIARRAAGFDMPMRYHGRRAHEGVALAFEADIAALASWADFLVLACRGGPETHHLIDAGVLQALGNNGYLINISRGSVVDEAALTQAIADGTLGGAGLDVYASEPQVPPGLLGRDNVVLLPHVAASTRETRRAMEQLVQDNLRAFFDSGRVLTPPAR
jgi:lactate dehydrogenase-like 2-hydroxyacid dehydrogenase